MGMCDAMPISAMKRAEHGKVIVILSYLHSKQCARATRLCDFHCLAPIVLLGSMEVLGTHWLIVLWAPVSSPGSPTAAHRPLMPYHQRERVAEK